MIVLIDICSKIEKPPSTRNAERLYIDFSYQASGKIYPPLTSELYHFRNALARGRIFIPKNRKEMIPCPKKGRKERMDDMQSR